MGAFLSAPRTDKTISTGENSRVQFATCEMQGWRISMEDAQIAALDVDSNGACIFGVYDGHGGKEVAIFVSRHLVQEYLQTTNYQMGRYGQALTDVYLHLDQMLMQENYKKELVRIMKDLPDDQEVTTEDQDLISGCTAVTGVIIQDKLYVANAGDSRLVLAKQGQAVSLTTDHKPDDEIENARIIKAGSVVEMGRVNGNLNLSRSIGDLEYKKNERLPPQEQAITCNPDITTYDLDSTVDFLVLACDGIWDMLTPQQCVDFVYQRINEKNLDTIAQELLDRCLAPDVASSGGLGCDNMTCVLVKFNK